MHLMVSIFSWAISLWEQSYYSGSTTVTITFPPQKLIDVIGPFPFIIGLDQGFIFKA